MVQIRSLEAELDERHRAANLAFARKDLLAYQQMFSPALIYQRADGEIVSRDQLMRDVALQFRNLSRSDSSYVRESLVTVGDQSDRNARAEIRCADNSVRHIAPALDSQSPR